MTSTNILLSSFKSTKYILIASTILLLLSKHNSNANNCAKDFLKISTEKILFHCV